MECPLDDWRSSVLLFARLLRKGQDGRVNDCMTDTPVDRLHSSPLYRHTAWFLVVMVVVRSYHAAHLLRHVQVQARFGRQAAPCDPQPGVHEKAATEGRGTHEQQPEPETEADR